MATRLPPNAIRLYHRGTPAGYDLYPVVVNERFTRTQNAPWERRVVTGPVGADSEQFISSWTQDDYSGGFGILDANEGTDTSRIAFGVIDGRRPKSMCLPPLTSEIAAPWTPDQLGSTVLRAWFKADAITGLTDGVTLSGGWNDSSGNARHATNGTDADRPLYQTSDLNSLPGVEFVSTDDLNTTLTASSHDETIMAVIDIDSVAAARAIVGDQTTGGRILRVETTGAISIVKGGGATLGTSTATIAINTPAIVGATTAAATVETHVNGVDETDAHAQTFTGSLSSSLGTSNGTATPFDGMIYEVVACSTLSVANREKLEGYLAHKWALTANLASDHPYKTTAPTATAFVGSFWPLGDVGTQFYAGSSTGIFGWKDTTDTWYPYTNHWPASFTPLGEAVMFCGGLFIPGGAQGFIRLSESSASTGALTVAQLSSITALAFGLYDGKLWAIDTANKLWMLTTTGAAAGATTLSNWNTSSDPGVAKKDAFGNYLILDTSLTPTALVNYPNAAGEESLWCITRGQGAYLLNPDEPRWIKSSIKEGAHPDWGLCAEVFRDGEDLFIAGGGLDLTRFTTANVEVPLSGPSKDQGVPPRYQGTIRDLCSERSSLYALVQAGTSVAAGSPTSTWVLQDTVGTLGSTTSPLAFNTPAQVAVDSTNRVLVADTTNKRLLILTSTGAYSTGITGLTGTTGVCCDSSDNIYVSHGGVGEVLVTKYSSALALLWTRTLTTTGGVGHIATDSTHVYVTDTTNDVIYKVDCAAGTLWSQLATYGSTGTGNDNFDTPGQAALDPSSNIFVADTANNRLIKRDSAGTFVSETTGLTGITGVCCDNSSNVYVLWDNGSDMRLRKYNSSLVTQWTVTFGGNTPGHLTTNGTHVWATDPSGLKVWKRLCSTGAAVANFGSAGSGDSQFGANGPSGISNDGTYIYVVDPSNTRVQKLTLAHSYTTAWTVGAGARGCAIDSSGNVVVAEFTGNLVKRYTNTGGAVDSFTQTAPDGVATAGGDVVYVTNATDDNLAKWDDVTTLASSGTGNGQFDTPRGIVYGSSELYIVDAGNSRVQVLNQSGTYQRKWTINSGAKGIALDASGDVWVAENANNQLRRFSSTGTFQTTIVQSTPNGIGVDTDIDKLYVSTGQHNLAIWDEETVASEAVDANTWLGAWTGTAWCALWESSTAMTPTWMRVAMKGDYALWWGNTAGTAYRQLLPPPFFNPAARVTLGVYPFAATGWMETVRFDAQMGGWDKIASHLFTMLDYAAADVYVDISYRTDADQWDSGDMDPPYRSWKRIDHIGRTLCWFDDTETDPISGLPYHEGEPFQWIQFRYDFARGSDTYKSPIWLWHAMHFLPVPQDAATFAFKIPVREKAFNRSPNEMSQTLRELARSRAMLHLQVSNPRPSQPDWQVFFRVRVTQVKSEFITGADNSLDEVVVLNCVEIEAANNDHTTLATDTPS